MIPFLFTAVIYGWIEANIYKVGWSSPPPHIYGLSIKYHGGLFALMAGVYVASVGFSPHGLWAVPLWLMTEDIFYYVFNSGDWTNEPDWNSFGLGGIRVLGLFVPNTYLILTVLSIILYHIL